MRLHAYILLLLVAVVVLPVPTAVVTAIGYVNPNPMDVNFNITTDENGTVYISLTGNMTIYNYSRTTITLGWYNESFIYVSYSGVFINSTDELIPIIIDIYNGTGANATLKYVFNASNPGLLPRNGNVVFYRELYNVTSFTNITYTVINATDNTVLYTGVLPPPPGAELIKYYHSNAYISWLPTLIPIALLFGFAGRGKVKMVGAGLIVYGVVLMMLPYLGIYPPHLPLLIVFSILLGIIILIMTR